MDDQALQTFRTLVNEDAGLREKFFEAYRSGPAALAAMASQHGFEASEERVLAAMKSVEADGELTDTELELVSGSMEKFASADPDTTQYREG
jgi:predicted ribosomally synthesized peptide with nif11-like leader